MLFVSMGTQPLQCERIVNTIIDSGIEDEIIIQAYYQNESNKKIPKNITIKQFIPYEEMDDYINKAEIVVVSGTGGTFRSLKKGKKVIIFPRLGKYNEAINDHGLDMIVLQEAGYAEFVNENDNFKEIYERCKKNNYKKYESNTIEFVKKLEREMEKL